MKNTFPFLFSEQSQDSELKSDNGSSRIALDPECVRNGLGQLVLTLMELLRQVLKKQAMRRIEGGSLTEDEIERLCLTFMELDRQMSWLKKEFDLTEKDLNLNIGPLGKLH